MRLVQRVMFRPEQVQQVHLAEVFLSGLLRRVSAEDCHPDEIEYDFLSEALRDRFLDMGLVTEAVQVQERISGYIANHYGSPVDFQAMLFNPEKINDLILTDKKHQAFAKVSAKILKRLGGEYEKLANWLMTENHIADPMAITQSKETLLILIYIEKWNEDRLSGSSYQLEYEPNFNYDATNCEFYVNAIGRGGFSHNGAYANRLQVYLSVAEQDGKLLNVGMWIHYRDTTNNKESVCFSFGFETEPNYWLTGFTFARGYGVARGSFSYTVCNFSFFIDVQKSTGEIIRFWQSRNGANYTLAEVFASEGYVERGGSSHIEYADNSSIIFEMKRICQYKKQVNKPKNKDKEELSKDYDTLLQLLKAKSWAKADEETKFLMLKLANKLEQGYLKAKDIEKIPCFDILAIDNLWLKYSGGKFGFSVQEKVFDKLQEFERGLIANYLGWTNPKLEEKLYKNFDFEWDDRYLNFSEDAPNGHIPSFKLFKPYTSFPSPLLSQAPPPAPPFPDIPPTDSDLAQMPSYMFRVEYYKNKEIERANWEKNWNKEWLEKENKLRNDAQADGSRLAKKQRQNTVFAFSTLMSKLRKCKQQGSK